DALAGRIGSARVCATDEVLGGGIPGEFSCGGITGGGQSCSIELRNPERGARGRAFPDEGA
ncbi:MAG: hypothetical protein Greene101449_269, partial [Candidatus Peregrinibacteria bacterium Greene1014_49]